jgi:hypothetical protein
MKKLLSAVLCLLVPGLLLACNAGEGTGLTLTETSASRLVGVLEGEGSRLSFDARAGTAGRTSLVLEIGGKPFSYSVDATTGVSELDGRGAVLTAEDKRTLAALAPALEVALATPAAALPEHVRSLAAISAYWSEAPAGYAHAGRTAQLPSGQGVSAQSVNNDGITCVKKGAAYKCTYDAGRTGTVYSENVTAGSNYGYNTTNGGTYDCMGRCGGGCSGVSIYGRYTFDCLEHDICSFRFSSSGGGSDANCGDEYDNAYDDFVNVGTYGCNGT